MRIGDYEVENNKITGEYLQSGRMIDIKTKVWESADKKIKRFYIERAGEPIGYIEADNGKGTGKGSTNQTYINRMVSALKEANANG
jgi:hypothetical protein